VAYYDMPAIRKIVREAAREDYTFAAIVTGLVSSEPFQMMRLPDVPGELQSRQAAVAAP
jgi:hypothetical protein